MERCDSTYDLDEAEINIYYFTIDIPLFFTYFDVELCHLNRLLKNEALECASAGEQIIN